MFGFIQITGSLKGSLYLHEIAVAYEKPLSHLFRYFSGGDEFSRLTIIGCALNVGVK